MVGEGDDRGWDGWMASLKGHDFEYTPGVGDGQVGLACCSPYGCKLDKTEWLNWTDYVGVCCSIQFSIFQPHSGETRMYNWKEFGYS